MVPRERKDGRRCLAPLAEHGDVGVPEPVDRLELVADDEEVAALDRREQVEQLGLQAVRVLELVDHDRAEPLPLALPDLRVVPEQVARAELEVLEVERGLAVLRVRVGGREGRQQLLQQLAVACGELLERRRDDGVARLREARGARAAHLQVAERRGAAREASTHRAGRAPPGRRHAAARSPPGRRRGTSAASRTPSTRSPSAARGTRLENELSTRRAERRVDLDEHPPETVRAVGRQELPAVGLVGGAERSSADVNASAWSTSACGSSSTRKPGSIPAARGYVPSSRRQKPWIVETQAPSSSSARSGRAALDEAGPDPCAKLAGRPLRVRDDENRVDVEAVVDHGADEALDEHRRLAGARAGGDEHGAVRLDRGALLVVRGRPHGRSLRHMRQRSHQCGHSPPLGSWRTSPSRIRSTSPTAVERAVSIASVNSSGSR